MDKKIMQKWVKALRSNKYKQGKHALNCDNRFCCLGVLCDLYQKDAKAKKKKMLDVYIGMSDGDTDLYYYDNEEERLPDRVKDWAGLFSPIGDISEVPNIEKSRYKAYESLAMMNDMGKKFSTIANFIEKNYKHL